MYQIKNVINYDREALDKELDADAERFFNDKRIWRLLRRRPLLLGTRSVVSFLGLACATTGLILTLSGVLMGLARVLAFLGLALSSFGLLVLSTAIPKAMHNNRSQLKAIMDTYGQSPAMKYHMFVTRHGVDGFEMWGVEDKDSRFEVTLTGTDENGHVAQESFVCDFEERVSNGVLVLDLRNGIVIRQ